MVLEFVATETGVDSVVPVQPLPSWPDAFDPQHFTLFSTTAQADLSPVETDRTLSAIAGASIIMASERTMN